MFRDGEKHGPGCLLTPDGDTLEGEWLKSKPQEGDVSFFLFFFVRVLLFFKYDTYESDLVFFLVTGIIRHLAPDIYNVVLRDR